MPNTEPHMLGVINLRGEVLPLFDLVAKPGLKTPEINVRSVIIVFEADKEVIGFLVDSVSNILTPQQDEISHRQRLQRAKAKTLWQHSRLWKKS